MSTHPTLVTTTSGQEFLARACTYYLLFQAGLGVVWWSALAASPTVREWFEMNPGQPEMLDSFLMADIVVVIGGSLLSAWAVHRDRPWAVLAVVFTAGTVVYPTLYLVSWVAFTGEGAATLAGMVAISTLHCWVGFQYWRSRSGASTP